MDRTGAAVLSSHGRIDHRSEPVRNHRALDLDDPLRLPRRAMSQLHRQHRSHHRLHVSQTLKSLANFGQEHTGSEYMTHVVSIH